MLRGNANFANRYETEVNQNFKVLALHYHTVVLLTRAYRPKDKALVGGCVRLNISTHFLPTRRGIGTSQ